MIMHLCLLKLSLLPHRFLVQTGAFVLLSFNGGQGVKPCKIFLGCSTVLANGLALNCTMEVYHPILAECLLLVLFDAFAIFMYENEAVVSAQLCKGLGYL